VGIAAWFVLTAMLITRRLHETTRRTPHVVEVIVTSIVVPLLSVYHRVRSGITFRVVFWVKAIPPKVPVRIDALARSASC